MTDPRDNIPDPLIEWLRAASPEERHQVAWNWNWDGGGLEPLRWIIRQPDCDRGTALMVFWMGNPHFLRDSDSGPEPEPLLKEIAERYVSGCYATERIAFDPSNDEGTDWTSAAGNGPPAQWIPAVMFRPTAGEKLERADFQEGWPPELSARYEWVLLHSFWRSGRPVELLRRRDETLVEKSVGFILGVGPELFLLGVLAEDLRPNGFRALRWRDLVECPREAHEALISHAFRLRGDAIPDSPPVDLSDWPALLRSIAAAFPLATVWAEDGESDHVTARITSVEAGHAVLKEPDGVDDWSHSMKWPFEWITRVDFGGGYETALASLLRVRVPER